MRYHIFTSFALLLFISGAKATIRTVSNSPAFPGQFASIDAAISASSVGDTIYVMPSSIGYGTASLTKKLVIIGSGLNPQPPSHLGSSMSNFVMDPQAAGSSIMGIAFSVGNTWGINNTYVDNLYIADCSFAELYMFGSNLVIENCVFYGMLYTGYNNTNNIYQNNIFNTGIVLRPPSNAVIRNNIFASNDANNQAFITPPNGESMGAAVQILNNIFFKNNPSPSPGHVANCTFIKNIYHLTTNPVPTNASSSGNLNADPLFVNFPGAGANFSFTYNYKLGPGSPGINYGSDGKDVGMWGGLVPVNAGFEPPIPRIYELTAVSNAVPVGGTLQLTIKATKAQ